MKININIEADYSPDACPPFRRRKILREYVSNGDREKFLTTQHERDAETGLDYRGARFYDSDMGRFLSLDPLAADYASWSPYNYVLANPIMYVDPDGKAPGNPYKINSGVLSGWNVISNITPETHRAKMKSVEGIVLHRTVSTSASGSIRHAKKQKGSVGFHAIVGNDGTVTQINDFDNRANHVGKPKGKINNYNSIGIEVVGMPIDKNGNPTTKSKDIVGWQDLTSEQIESTSQMVHSIMKSYNLKMEDIFPHEDVSWKTAGEGQTVMDQIQGRLTELYNTPADSSADDFEAHKKAEQEKKSIAP